MNHWIKPITLIGQHATLEPMNTDHEEDLKQAVQDGELWKLWYTHIPKPEAVSNYIQDALVEQEQFASVPFVIREKKNNKIIGSTRFCHIDNVQKRVEIGYTWYGKSYQRTAINTECKLMLLSHAFESLEVIAVEFRTHWHNHASRNAIARLGAKQDGILRNHAKMADGSYRDTVVFSITNHEWSVVKQSLKFKLGL